MWVSVNSGGLCNRIKSLISALRLDKAARIYWKKNHKTFCQFSDLFKNDIEINYIPEDAYLYDSWRFCIIKNGTLYIPEDEKEYYDFKYNEVDNSVKIEIKDIIKGFVFNDYVQSQVNNFEMPADCISVQIRTWHEKPHLERYRNYDINNYFEVVDKLDGRPVFVTSDHKKPVHIMTKRYGNRIITYPKRTNFGDRNTARGMQDIMVDLLLSSKNNIIVGDALSTFTEMSWFFGGYKTRIITIG